MITADQREYVDSRIRNLARIAADADGNPLTATGWWGYGHYDTPTWGHPDIDYCVSVWDDNWCYVFAAGEQVAQRRITKAYEHAVLACTPGDPYYEGPEEVE